MKRISLTASSLCWFGTSLLMVGSFSACQKQGKNAANAAGANTADVSIPEKIDFNAHVRPVLNKNCTSCHGGVKAAGGLSFLFREQAIVKGESGEWSVKPGDPDSSMVMKRIVDASDPMPPEEHGHMLAERDVKILQRWIEQGAEWGTHWAYIAPKAAELPSVQQKDWPKQRVDHFVLSELEKNGMKPNQAETHERLMRRISFDLIGLPPSLAELNQYKGKPLAEYVDHLMAKPSFGERWASMWMDLSRYADSMGYEKDPHRDMWPFRDYLIRSLNADKPYSQLVTEFIGGDLMAENSYEAMVGAGFHRNSQTNTEGGTDDEEFRVSAVVDRVNTTWEVFQGTSMACVQCHSHPYDPIRHEEYFKSYAFFNNSVDSDDWDAPKLKIPNDPAKFPEVAAVRRDYLASKTAYQESVRSLVKQDAWEKVEYGKIGFEGGGKLVADATGAIHSEGTVPFNATYQVRFKTKATQLNALRLDALPLGENGIVSNGFKLGQVELLLHQAGQAPQNIEFQIAYADEAREETNLQEILKPSNEGWHLYPRLHYPHYLILVTKTPVTLPQGAELELRLAHKTYDEANAATLRKFRVSLSQKEAWNQLATQPEHRALGQRVAELRGKMFSYPGTDMPVMLERPAELKRRSFVFERGNWMSPGAEVEPGVPGEMPPLKGQSRLDFARWLADRENPLTARVYVNRVWAKLLGRGIVATLGDFGTQGDAPSHPALLDDLAVRFMDEMGWKLKPLLKEIVLSSTYQQSSEVDAVQREKDPYNALLARGPRQRLEAEMVRDQALMVSGLLSSKLFGPSVKPPQPSNVWQTIYSGDNWKEAQGEDRYRRAIYTYWKRTSPYPSLLTFDAPTRDVCSVQRIDTNTPLQALVKMNDPVYIEASKKLAEKMQKMGLAKEETLRQVYFELTAQMPSDTTLKELSQLYEKSLKNYQQDKAASEKMAPNPELAALCIVADVLLNLDQALTK